MGSAQAATSTNYTTFSGSSAAPGWETCATPVTWTVDVNGMGLTAARQEIQRLKAALATWSRGSGVPVEFKGQQDLRWDAATNTLKPADGSQVRKRHVYIGFFSASVVSGLSGSVVGLAMPTSVVNKAFDGGMAVFRRGYVMHERSAMPAHLASLYLHELGHVWGLGHSTSTANVMYPTLGTLTDLGPGDRLGVETVTRKCSTS